MQKRVTLGIEPSGEARMTLPCEEKLCGEDGHRSHYLVHAKHALYHLSYIPESVLVKATQAKSGG